MEEREMFEMRASILPPRPGVKIVTGQHLAKSSVGYPLRLRAQRKPRFDHVNGNGNAGVPSLMTDDALDRLVAVIGADPCWLRLIARRSHSCRCRQRSEGPS